MKLDALKTRSVHRFIHPEVTAAVSEYLLFISETGCVNKLNKPFLFE
jgi:hypothetical protein